MSIFTTAFNKLLYVQAELGNKEKNCIQIDKEIKLFTDNIILYFSKISKNQQQPNTSRKKLQVQDNNITYKNRGVFFRISLQCYRIQNQHTKIGSIFVQ